MTLLIKDGVHKRGSTKRITYMKGYKCGKLGILVVAHQLNAAVMNCAFGHFVTELHQRRNCKSPQG